MASLHFVVAYLAIFSMMVIPSLTQLSPTFYHQVCPLALPTIKAVVRAAVLLQPRMGASLVRLHFHDCFVNGCDGSILLDDNSTFIGEKTALPNNNSVRGFNVIDIIKLAVDKVCFGHVVSCADILAVAARDSVVSLGGASYQVQVGRRDSTTASRSAANTNLPPPFFDFPALLSNFQAQGMNLQDLVVLSGSHTIGFARCTTFRSRIYNETTINSSFAASRQVRCPQSGGDNNLSPLDGSGTSATFDTNYYSSLLQQKGLLHSDQQLFQGDGSTRDGLVKFYSQNKTAFWADFGQDGEIGRPHWDQWRDP